jgi:hypothetical protein
MSNTKDIEKFIDKLDGKELDAALAALSDLNADLEKDPIKKFLMISPSQINYLRSTEDILINLCGNNFGKTTCNARFLAGMATGYDTNVRHRPNRTRPILVWAFGADYSFLNDVFLVELEKYLRPSEYSVAKINSLVNKLEIYCKNPDGTPGTANKNGGVTKVTFKPVDKVKDGSVKLEGANLHYAIIDEGVTEGIFSQIVARCRADGGGQVLQAFTRLPKNMHLASYLIDMEDGDGRWAKYIVDESGNNEAMRKDPDRKHLTIKLMYGSYNDNPMSGDYDTVLEAMSENEEELTARLTGKLSRPSGLVLNYRKKVGDLYYNLCPWSEFVNIFYKNKLTLERNPGTFAITHDYGIKKSAITWHLIWTDNRTGTSYTIDEVYLKGVSRQESCEAAGDMIRRWRCYDSLRLCFPDRQVFNPDSKNNKYDREFNAALYYKESQMPDGSFCFPPKLIWRNSNKDKTDKNNVLEMMSELVEEENPLTPKKPYWRILPNCKHLIKEVRRLTWVLPKGNSSASGKLKTEGEDHCIDPHRYFFKNKVNKKYWERRRKVRYLVSKEALRKGKQSLKMFNI